VLFLCSCANSDYVIIDNGQLRRYVPERFRTKAKLIAYGVAPLKSQKWDSLLDESSFKHKMMNVKPHEYWLVVARLEPDNNIEMIVEGYLRSASRKPILIVGEFTSEKFRRLVNGMIHDRETADRIIMLGAIQNQSHLGTLREHCLAYIHGHSVGGTNPSLLEAMIARNIIIAHDNPFNREVSSESALYFSDASSLSHAIKSVEQNENGFASLREQAGRRAIDYYSWNRIVSEYDTLLKTSILEPDR
jgi:rhamnosyltransferase